MTGGMSAAKWMVREVNGIEDSDTLGWDDS